MHVKVKLFAISRELAGAKEIIVAPNSDDVTIGDVLEELREILGARFYKFVKENWERGGFIILLNDQDIRSDKGLNTLIRGDSEIVMYPSGTGGKIMLCFHF